MSRFVPSALLVFVFVLAGCPKDGGSGSSTEQTGQVNTVADIQNKLEAQHRTVEIHDCTILVIKDSNGNVINSGSISDIRSGINTANTFGAITDQQAKAGQDFIDKTLENADCPAPGN